jgi:hypothetical protein
MISILIVEEMIEIKPNQDYSFLDDKKYFDTLLIKKHFN